MTNKLPVVALATLILAGCSSTRDVYVADDASIGTSRVNESTRGKLARLHLEDGRVFYAADVRIASDSTRWRDPSTMDFAASPTSNVERVTLIRAGQGALVGIGAGVVLGVATGLLRAQLEGDDPLNDYPHRTKSEKMFLLPAAHATYFVLGTAPLGAIVGRKTTYRIVHE